MSQLTGISLNLHGSLLLMAALLLSGLVAVYFMYRRTTPPTRLRRRLLLAFLRTGALLALVLLLFTPVITLSYDENIKPQLAVLIDSSASMGIVDRTTDRPAETLAVLQSEAVNGLSRDFDVLYYTFDRTVEDFSAGKIGDLEFDGEGTDISYALDYIGKKTQETPLRGVILVSDGGYTVGENPVGAAGRLGVPLYSVGIGDPSQQKDVLISNIQTRDVAYAGKTLPVTISVRSSGYGGSRATVVLSSGGKNLDSQVIQLPDNNRERSIDLRFTPEKPGIMKIQVDVSPQRSELTRANNRRDISVRVLESRINIAVISGRPNQDYAFLTRSLEQNDDFTVTGVTLTSRGTSAGTVSTLVDNLNSYHLFILIDFPGGTAPGNLLRNLRQAIETDGKPVMYIRGEQVTADQIKALSGILPVKALAEFDGGGEVYLHLTPEAREHPAFRIVNNSGDNAALWQRLPPVFTGGGIPVPVNGADIMGVVDENRSGKTDFTGTVPLVFLNESGGRKSFFINAYNIWRWRLMALRDVEIAGLYDVFVRNTIRWLVTKQDTKLVRITPSKEFYQNGEQIVINGQVYTEDYEPVNNADVQITVGKPGITLSRTLQSLGDGRYTATLKILEPGNYSLTGAAYLDDRRLGDDTTEFAIGEFSVELLRTATDSTLLEQLARSSGGRYLNSQEVMSLPGYLNPEPIIRHKNITVEIWNRLWFLAAIVFLLCLEWFFRRKLGML